MSPRVHRTVGLLLIVASLTAAVVVQFLGGGLVELGDLQPTEPGPGRGHVIWLSVHVKLRWPAAIPAVLAAASLAWWIVGRRKPGPRPVPK